LIDFAYEYTLPNNRIVLMHGKLLPPASPLPTPFPRLNQRLGACAPLEVWYFVRWSKSVPRHITQGSNDSNDSGPPAMAFAHLSSSATIQYHGSTIARVSHAFGNSIISHGSAKTDRHFGLDTATAIFIINCIHHHMCGIHHATWCTHLFARCYRVSILTGA